jgi:hypothetical protein
MKRGLISHPLPWLVVLAVSIATQVAAQDKPDFSGHWVLESGSQSAADVPEALEVSQSLVRTNVYGQPMPPFFKDITVVRAFENGARSETYQIGVEGGTVSGGTAERADQPRSQYHYHVAWESETLVMEFGSYTGPAPESGQWTERREEWLLDPGGRLRVAITTRSSSAASSTVTQVYRRR